MSAYLVELNFSTVPERRLQARCPLMVAFVYFAVLLASGPSYSQRNQAQHITVLWIWSNVVLIWVCHSWLIYFQAQVTWKAACFEWGPEQEKDWHLLFAADKSLAFWVTAEPLDLPLQWPYFQRSSHPEVLDGHNLGMQFNPQQGEALPGDTMMIPSNS